MKVEITFTAEGDDGDLADLHGTRLVMTGLDRASFSVSTDTVMGADGKHEVMPTGALKVRAHGQRAAWTKDDR